MFDEEAALLRAVCEKSDDDLPRLVYADWLDEHGRPERAEFVRMQVTIAPFVTRPRGGRTNTPTHRCTVCGALWTRWPDGPKPGDGGWSLASRDCGSCCDNVVMGDQIAVLDDSVVTLFRRADELSGEHEVEWLKPWPLWEVGFQANSTWVPEADWEWHRGFIYAVACPAAAWLAHASRIAWRPTWADPCGECGGRGEVGTLAGRMGCPACSKGPFDRGSGTVPRPFPGAAAQPIRRVRLNTPPQVVEFDDPDRPSRYGLLGRPARSRRELFPNSDGAEIGHEMLVHAVLAAEWPGIVFDLPPAD